MSEVNTLFKKKSTLYKIPKKPKEFTHFEVHEVNEQHQADLIQLPKFKKYEYVLVEIDLYSRYVKATPLTNKRSETITKAFQKHHTRDYTPKHITCDSGSEFMGATKKYFDSQKISILYGEPHLHRDNAIVERVNKTLEHWLFKLLDEEDSNDWLKLLPRVVKFYNERVHGTTKQKPIDVLKGKSIPKERSTKKDSLSPIKTPLKVGTSVRVQLYDDNRNRVGNEHYSKKIYKIKEAKFIQGIPKYRVTNEEEEIDRWLYREELIEPTKAEIEYNKVWVVEKIVSHKIVRGKLHYKVRWKGFLSSEDSWESYENLRLDNINKMSWAEKKYFDTLSKEKKILLKSYLDVS